MLEAFRRARARRASYEHPETHNYNQNLAVTGHSPERRGHARPDSWKGLIIPSPPYALGGDDWSDLHRDYMGLPVSFRNANGEIVPPNDY